LERFEAVYEDFFDKALLGFLNHIRRAAVDALAAPVIVASASSFGVVKDPFAWTTVRNQWYATIREMTARRADIMVPDIVSLLEESMLPVQVYDDVATVLKSSVAEGWSEWRTKRELSSLLVPKRKDSSVEKYRATVRGLARSAANANMNQQVVTELVREGWSHKAWFGVMDERTRPSHAEVHGQTVPVNGRFMVGGALMVCPGDRSAPIGEWINCFPGDTPVRFGRVKAVFRSWYEGELVEVSTVEEGTFSVTPNHPILTSFGWVPAGILHDGLELVHHVPDLIRGDLARGEGVDGSPTMIGEVFDSLSSISMTGGFVGQDCLRVDLEGEGGYGYVDVVPLDGHLGDTGVTPADEFLHELGFMHPDVDHFGLTRDGTGNKFFGVPLNPTDSSVSGGSVGGIFFGGAVSHHEPIGVGVPPDFHTIADDNASDGVAGNTDSFSYGVLGFPGKIRLDKVIGVNRRYFSGHVFNLSTGTGAYTASGYIVHNCRCWLMPAGSSLYDEYED
jgi:hypothetical protein